MSVYVRLSMEGPCRKLNLRVLASPLSNMTVLFHYVFHEKLLPLVRTTFLSSS